MSQKSSRIAILLSYLFLLCLGQTAIAFPPKNNSDSSTERYTTHAGMTRVALEVAFANGTFVEVERQGWGNVVVKGAVWEDECFIKPVFYKVLLDGGAARECVSFRGNVLDMSTLDLILDHYVEGHLESHTLTWRLFTNLSHFHHRYALDPHVLSLNVPQAELVGLVERLVADTVAPSKSHGLADKIVRGLSKDRHWPTGREYATSLFDEAVATYVSGDKPTAYHILGRVAHIFEDQATLLHALLIQHWPASSSLTIEGGEVIETFWGSIPYDDDQGNYGSDFPLVLREFSNIATGLDELNSDMLKIAEQYPIFGKPGTDAFQSQISSTRPPRKVKPKTISEEEAVDIVHKSVPIATSYVAGLFKLFEEKVQKTVAVHLCVVLDRSGSMKGDKMNAAEKAAISILSYLDSSDGISVVSFSDSATTNIAMTRVSGDAARDLIADDISQISASGGTNYSAGLTEAHDLLVPSRALRAKAILFLSDGLPTKADSYSEVVGMLKQVGIPVYTIGFGTDVSEAVLKKLAQSTGGDYFPGSEGNLQQVFDRIAGRAKGLTEYIVRRGVIRKAQRLVETLQLRNTGLYSGNLITASVNFPSQVKFALHWRGSNLGLTLVPPSGTPILETNAVSFPGVEFVDSGNNTKVFTIENPMHGEWQAIVEGLDVPDEGELYALTVSVGTPWPLNPNPFEPHYSSGDTVLLGVSASRAHNVSLNQVKATVFSRLGNLGEIQLNDSGRSGDEQAGDGTYSSLFIKTNDVGLYHVRYEIAGVLDGREVTRHIESTFQVGTDKQVIKAETRMACEEVVRNVQSEWPVRIGTSQAVVYKRIDLGRDLDFGRITLRLSTINSSDPDLVGKIYNFRFHSYEVAGHVYTRLVIKVFPALLPQSGSFEAALRLTATAPNTECSAVLNLMISR